MLFCSLKKMYWAHFQDRSFLKVAVYFATRWQRYRGTKQQCLPDWSLSLSHLTAIYRIKGDIIYISQAADALLFLPCLTQRVDNLF